MNSFHGRHPVVKSLCVAVVKNPPANAGDTRDAGSIFGLESSPGGGYGNHSSILAWRTPMDRGAWRTAVRGVTKSQTRLKRLSTHASCTTQIGFPFQSEAVYSLEKAASAPVCSSLPTNV